MDGATRGELVAGGGDGVGGGPDSDALAGEHRADKEPPPSIPDPAAGAANGKPAQPPGGDEPGSAVAAADATAPPKEELPAAVKTGYPQFLEKFRHPSAQHVVNAVREFVNSFPPSLTRPQAARRIHTFLSTTTRQLLETDALKGDPSEEARQCAEEGLEKFVVLKLHKLLFRHAPADVREDERVDRCIKASKLGALPPGLSREAREYFAASLQELRKLDQYRAPREKVIPMMNACRMAEFLVRELRETGGGGAGSADAGDPKLFQRILVALIVQAAPPNLYSNIEFAGAFRHPNHLVEEEQSCLRAFAFAMAAVAGSNGLAGWAPSSSAIAAPFANGVAGPETAAAPKMPPWLVDAGVTLHFEHRAAADELLLGEIEELHCEYKRMVHVLRELVGCGPAAKAK